ncbi:MAG TPA: hypothetical protein PLS03_06860 [Terrimicrobiaceae bacterium]|nr:hypothetical protein [Terrimicrobiaceae bacterium]
MRFLTSIVMFFIAFGIAAAFVGVTVGCSNARTEALQRRQSWYNNQSSQRDQRRAIRAQNMDARTGFDLPDM